MTTYGNISKCHCGKCICEPVRAGVLLPCTSRMQMEAGLLMNFDVFPCVGNLTMSPHDLFRCQDLTIITLHRQRVQVTGCSRSRLA